MKKIFIFKNLGTAKVCNVLADGVTLGTGLDWAIRYILDIEGWRTEDIKFLGSRTADRFMNFPERGSL